MIHAIVVQVKSLKSAMESNILKVGKYKHYKGKEYEVVGIAKHSETLEDLVVYKALYKNELSELWVRPLELFVGDVEVDGKKVPRFEFVG